MKNYMNILKKSLISALVLGISMPGLAMQEKKQSKKLIFSDFHDVVTKMDAKSMLLKLGGVVAGTGILSFLGAKLGGKLGGKTLTRIFATLPWFTVAGIIGDKMYRSRAFKKTHGYEPVEEYIYDQDPILRFVKPFFVQLSSDFVPNKEVLELYKKKKEDGYSIVLVSNLAPESRKVLEKRYPEMFDIFKDKDGNVQIIAPTPENGWLDKNKDPQKYYSQVNERMIQEGLDEALYIDDKQKNCDAIQEVFKQISTNKKIETFCYNTKNKNINVALEEAIK